MHQEPPEANRMGGEGAGSRLGNREPKRFSEGTMVYEEKANYKCSLGDCLLLCMGTPIQKADKHLDEPKTVGSYGSKQDWGHIRRHVSQGLPYGQVWQDTDWQMGMEALQGSGNAELKGERRQRQAGWQRCRPAWYTCRSSACLETQQQHTYRGRAPKKVQRGSQKSRRVRLQMWIQRGGEGQAMTAID